MPQLNCASLYSLFTKIDIVGIGEMAKQAHVTVKKKKINFEVLDCCVVVNNDEMIKVLIHSCVFFGLHCANRIVLKQGVRSQ